MDTTNSLSWEKLAILSQSPSQVILVDNLDQLVIGRPQFLLHIDEGESLHVRVPSLEWTILVHSYLPDPLNLNVHHILKEQTV